MACTYMHQIEQLYMFSSEMCRVTSVVWCKASEHYSLKQPQQTWYNIIIYAKRYRIQGRPYFFWSYLHLLVFLYSKQ